MVTCLGETLERVGEVEGDLLLEPHHSCRLLTVYTPWDGTSRPHLVLLWEGLFLGGGTLGTPGSDATP